MGELDPEYASDLRLVAAAHALARGADLEATLDTLMRLAAEEVAADVALVAAIDEDRSRLHFVYGLGLEAADIEAVERSTDDLADPLVAAAVGRTPLEVGPGEGGGGLGARLALRRLLAVPLVVVRDGIEVGAGVLALGWSTAPATSDAAAGDAPASAATGAAPGVAVVPALVAAIADLAAVAVDRARLAAHTAERAEWFERLTHLDPLTGLANRRTFDRVLELELARAGRQQSEVCVLVFDVDAFREVNETAGRAVGDDILRAVAAVLAEQVRLVDTVARIGGDEFVIVAPGSGGIVVATRVLQAIRGLAPVSGLPVSVSAGIARFPADGTSGQAMLDAALAAVAAARAGGTGAIAEATSGS